MGFDEKTKQLARAHDAVDRLREVEGRFKQRQENEAKLHDVIVRGAILGLTIYLIVFAYKQL